MEGFKSMRRSRAFDSPTTSGWGEARRRRHEGRRAAGGGACGSGAGAQGGGRAVAGGVAEGMVCTRNLFIGGARRWGGQGAPGSRTASSAAINGGRADLGVAERREH